MDARGRNGEAPPVAANPPGGGGYLTLSDLSIRRPVFATVLSLLLLILGVMAALRLPVREYPNVTQPVVSVQTTYRGASAGRGPRRASRRCSRTSSPASKASTSSPRRAATKPPRSTSSSCRAGTSRPAPTTCAIACRACWRDCPKKPIRRRSTRSAIPPTRSSFSCSRAPRSTRSSSPTTPTATSKTASPRCRAWHRCRCSGPRRYAMRIWLDRSAMAARLVAVSDIESALRAENVELPADASSRRSASSRCARPRR